MNKPSERFEWGPDDIEIETPEKKPERPQERTKDQRARTPLVTVNGRPVTPVIHRKK